MRGIITNDRRMRDLLQLAKTVAQSRATVLIQGESGTGKELMARFLHENSLRSSRPYIAINCAAIPENLLESELFGYEKGAFTGAGNSTAGKFELANGGTLLLDEISEMDIRLQSKLLRVIQEGQVDRIGGRRPIAVDVRLIATTNRNLGDCVKEGAFREDLFYRLNVVNLNIPPLRERVGDVELLANSLIERHNANDPVKVISITKEAIHLLNAHQWMGNVRELENVIERAILTSPTDVITPTDIGIDRSLIQMPEEGDEIDQAVNWRPGQTLDDIERFVILEALEHHSGNRTHTAKALGVSIRTLRNKLATYRQMGIEV
jgi:two-component system, response regulator FlrC